MLDVATVFDRLKVRCPSLGGMVAFNYCRKAADGLPCSKALVCWEASFPVGRYMAGILTLEEWERAFTQPPKNRLAVILEAADRASKNRPDEP